MLKTAVFREATPRCLYEEPAAAVMSRPVKNFQNFIIAKNGLQLQDKFTHGRICIRPVNCAACDQAPETCRQILLNSSGSRLAWPTSKPASPGIRIYWPALVALIEPP